MPVSSPKLFTTGSDTKHRNKMEFVFVIGYAIFMIRYLINFDKLYSAWQPSADAESVKPLTINFG